MEDYPGCRYVDRVKASFSISAFTIPHLRATPCRHSPIIRGFEMESFVASQ